MLYDHQSIPWLWTLLFAALQHLASGVKYDEIKVTTGVPKSTVSRYETILKNGGKPRSTPGPRPILSTALEDDIYSWVVAMQMAGFPVGRTDICAKDNLVCEVLNIGCVTDGWYQRFLGRYPDLTSRVAQVVSRSRNGPTKDAMITLFGTLQKLVIELKLDATRIFNMDESPFLSRTKSKTVVALRGSHNVWTTEPPSSAHISYLAYVSAPGLLVPPLFILPGARVTEDIALAANVSDCRQEEKDRRRWRAFIDRGYDQSRAPGECLTEACKGEESS
ncbi:hypothetical protein ACHHYP_11770 [Achlya hypogyna]|uniref:HTH CENPB-type domain-containing protein n=1 Tax=Achlya hypogyna TaxID=1202772 RepID=A0A1V9YIB5_ACHHY|nr:hypothetical protein ACHHYP_11770 [Achlya hypogyna]